MQEEEGILFFGRACRDRGINLEPAPRDTEIAVCMLCMIHITHIMFMLHILLIIYILLIVCMICGVCKI